MVLTKDELVAALRNEVRLVLHLASKVEPGKLDYRPSANQRSLLEVLRYFVLVGPIHLRGALADKFDINAWRDAWRTGEATVNTMNLEEVKEAIGKLPALFTELLSECPDTRLRAEYEMFGSKRSRGAWIVYLVLCHYSAYRMQTFLYLKASGREELSTMNLWAGMDAK
jgi:hypothetical protein